MNSLNRTAPVAKTSLPYQLRFSLLHDSSAWMEFPCDQSGHVDTGSLTELTRMIYLGACAMQGNYYAFPTIHFAPN